MSNPAESFEPYRRRLLGLAYRMLGSMADAEDAVQEAYVRWHSANRDTVSDARAFLMTTTTRICLDMLTSAGARREEYVGPWLPEPVLDTAALAPDSRTELAEDLSIALLLTLERLSPLERAAFLLHDVFDFSFSEVATALERSAAACRQLAARARAHVRAARPLGATALPPRSGQIDAKHAQLMSAFAAAAQSGDLNALKQLLASDVRVVMDGGGKIRAAQGVIDGADRVAQFLVGLTRKTREGAWWRDDFTLRFGSINGLPAVIVEAPEGPVQTAAFEIEGGVVRALYVVRNPDKLRHLAVRMSQYPRTRELLDHLDRNRSIFDAAVRGVPEQACGLRSSPGSWSVAEIVHHVAIVEERVAALLRDRLSAAVDAGLAVAHETGSALAGFDEARVRDRGRRVTASEAAQPAVGIALSEALGALEHARSSVRELVAHADGLAAGTIVHPHPALGALTFYQWVGFIGSHEARHADQVREVGAALAGR